MKTNHGRLIYASSRQSADLLYLTGFLSPDPVLYLEVPGCRYLLLSAMEVERARQQCKKSILPLSYAEASERWKLSRNQKTPLTLTQLILGCALFHQVWNWEVPFDFPQGLSEKLLPVLRQNAPDGKTFLSVPATPFCPGRLRKNKKEIACIQKAERIAEAGMIRGFEILKQAAIGKDNLLRYQGKILTAERLRGEINGAMLQLGGFCDETITAPGRQSASPHQVGHGPIAAHEPIVFDLFPRDLETGYWGDLSRTVVKGNATEEVRRAFETVREIQAQVSRALRPGILGKEIQAMVEKYFSKRGYKTDLDAAIPYGFIHSVGHGVGLEIHEQPTLSARGNQPLAPGHVLSNEPGLYYPDWGGIRIEDLLVITEDGARNLARLPIFLEIP